MRRAGLAALVLVLAAAPVGAQQGLPPAPTGVCQLQFSPRSAGRPPRVTSVQQSSGQYNSFIGGGFTARCPAQNLTLVADSGEYYGDGQLLVLIGRVHYDEPRMTLDSRRAEYYMLEERLLALGDVHSRLASGTTLDGPRLEYFRPAPNIRPASRMIAPGRPTIHLAQTDSTGKPAEPTQIVANTVVTEADTLVYASGNVEISRSDLFAKSDSAFMNSQSEFARLMRGAPSITAKGQRPFTLSGTVIDLFGANRKLDRVIAHGKGKGVSQDATLLADTLDLRLERGLLQRVYGWGPTRARATDPTYDVIADSLDARMPDQRLREIRAVRNAFAQSAPDTTRIRTVERDWLRGDTIFASFDSTARPAADTGKHQPRLAELRAHGHASSFYQIAARDTGRAEPGINYVRGRDITVHFGNNQVRTVTVAEQAAGVYLDPTPPGADTTADTASTRAARATSRRRAAPPARPAPPARSTRPPRPPAEGS